MSILDNHIHYTLCLYFMLYLVSLSCMFMLNVYAVFVYCICVLQVYAVFVCCI